MRLVWSTVASVCSKSAAVQSLEVALDDGTVGTSVAYTDLTGTCEVGDRVLVNTTAVDLALGTGGEHLVVARAAGCSGVTLQDPSGGHIMKLRYTPLQRDVLAVESQESPWHDVMTRAERLSGMPVVCCGLHSQVPLVAAAMKHANPELRVAYCMTDSAALTIHLSEVVRSALAAGLLDTTITCGQAFGGQYEAVNLHTGLLAASHVADADVAIAAIGPGVVGTATPFGHGGIAQGEAINAVAVLGGRAIATLRLSFADSRERHRILSHHTVSALTQVALAPAKIAVPTIPAPFADELEQALADSGIWRLHERADALAGSMSPPDMRGLSVTTMGRSIDDDPAFFAAAFAAGEVAATLAIDAT